MFLLTKEQQKLRAELREFVDHEVCPVATELDNRGGFPHDLYARIGKMGYLDAEFEYIGSGAKYGSLEGAIIIEELSRGLASLGLIVSPHYQCTELIACCGTETLKKKVIEPARRGELLFAFAIYTLHKELAHMSFRDLRKAFALIPISGVFFGLLVAAVNYVILSFNDMYSAHEIGVRLPYPKVGVISFVSNAIGFNLGASAISGGAVRYRLFSTLGLDGGQVGRIVALNQISLFFGPCLVAAPAFFFAPDTIFAHFGWPQYVRYLIALCCALAPALALCAGAAAAHGQDLRTVRVGFFAFD